MFYAECMVLPSLSGPRTDCLRACRLKSAAIPLPDRHMNRLLGSVPHVLARHVICREESLHGVGFPVGVDDADVRVSSGTAIELRQYPKEVRQQDAIHAPVADDQNGLARALADEAVDGS